MFLETKFLIGLFILVCIGAFLASIFTGGTSALTPIINNMTNIGCAFQGVNVITGLFNIVYQTASFVFNMASLVIHCALWDFWFFNNFEWLRSILISINVAIVIKIIYDLYRLAKPFGT
jgi:hypothetical protein